MSLGHEVEDAGNIHVRLPEEQPFGNQSAQYLKEIAETTTEVANRVYQTLVDGCFPVTLGGDHSIAVGSIAGVAKYLSRAESGNRVVSGSTLMPT